FADSLRPHEQQPERLRHWVLLNEFFGGQLCAFDRTIRRSDSVKIVELTMLVAAWNFRVRQQAIEPGRLPAITADDPPDAVTLNRGPACPMALRTNFLSHDRHCNRAPSSDIPRAGEPAANGGVC